MAYAQAIRTLIVECHAYLADLKGEAKGLAEVLALLQRWEYGPVNQIAAQPAPACGYLDEAFALARQQGNAPLAKAIEAARQYLCWVTYDLYPRAEIGNRFPIAHAFASIIGTAGFVHAEDFELGLFLIAPRTLYRDHHHPAPELYAPLTGPTQWRFGVSSPWQTRQANEPVWNESLAVHATMVEAQPLLCLYCWTRDVNLSAHVVAADDWDAIEDQL